MSTDLIWQITRDNSSFLVKRNGIQLSRERGNVLNRNSFKFSGVSARKVKYIAIDLMAVMI